MGRFRTILDSVAWLGVGFGVIALVLCWVATDFKLHFASGALGLLCLGVAICLQMMLLIITVIRRRTMEASINSHKMLAIDQVKRYLGSGEATKGASFHILLDNVCEIVGASFTEYTSHRAWCTVREVLQDKNNQITIKGGDEDFHEPQYPTEAFYAIWAYICGDGPGFYLCNDIETEWTSWLAGEPGPDGHVQPVDSHSWSIFYRDFVRLFGRRVALARRALLVLPIWGNHEASWLDGNRDPNMEGQIVRRAWGYAAISCEFAKTLDADKSVELATFYVKQIEDVIHAMFPGNKPQRIVHR